MHTQPFLIRVKKKHKAVSMCKLYTWKIPQLEIKAVFSHAELLGEKIYVWVGGTCYFGWTLSLEECNRIYIWKGESFDKTLFSTSFIKAEINSWYVKSVAIHHHTFLYSHFFLCHANAFEFYLMALMLLLFYDHIFFTASISFQLFSSVPSLLFLFPFIFDTYINFIILGCHRWS